MFQTVVTGLEKSMNKNPVFNLLALSGAQLMSRLSGFTVLTQNHSLCSLSILNIHNISLFYCMTIHVFDVNLFRMEGNGSVHSDQSLEKS